MLATRNTLVGLIKARAPAPRDSSMPALYRKSELPESLPCDQWTIEHLLDVAAVAQDDAYDLADSAEYIEGICRLAVERDAAARLAQLQLEECRLLLEQERATVVRLKRDYNLERTIAGLAYCDLAGQMERRDHPLLNDMEDTQVVDADWVELESE